MQFDKKVGSIESKFHKAKIIFHGFGTFTKLKTKAEQMNFIKPLPHFDPLGSGAATEYAKSQTLIIDLSNETFVVSW